MAAERLTVRVVSPERTVFEGLARAVVVPAWDGMLGILRGHAPLVTLLGTGHVRVRDDNGQSRIRVSGGVLAVRQDEVIILSDHAEAVSG